MNQAATANLSATPQARRVTRLSVLLCFYNVDKYLSAAIESILNQSFRQFELLLLDDGSTDQSGAIAARYAQADPRVRLIRSERNRGIAATMNSGIAEAKEEWIALMDSDDISLPSRFERQIDYLNRHPDLVAVGCFPLFVDEQERPICVLDIYRERHEEIEELLLSGNGWAFLKPTVVIEKAVAQKLGGFREDLRTSEDLDFFLRAGEMGRIANVPEILFHYRLRPNSLTHGQTIENRKRHLAVLSDAYKRRGLSRQLPMDSNSSVPVKPVDHYRKWGWWALSHRNIGTARHMALRAVQLEPLSTHSWRLALCALRGH